MLFVYKFIYSSVYDHNINYILIPNVFYLFGVNLTTGLFIFGAIVKQKSKIKWPKRKSPSRGPQA